MFTNQAIIFLVLLLFQQGGLAKSSRTFLEQVKNIASKKDPYARKIALQNAVRLGSLEANQNSCQFRSTVHKLKGLTGDQRKYSIIALSMISDKWVAQLRLAELGVPSEGTKFNPNDKYPHIQDPELPQQSWSGSGVTGVSPAQQPMIPLKDQYRLYRGHEETTGRYKHKVPFLEPEQATKPTYTNEQYIDAFLNMPIVTKDPDAYCNELPSRASVIRVAACRYGIHPTYLASFLVMENSDQTVNEDKVDYQGGVGYFGYGKNTSIGIGQIQINNGIKNGGEIFSDLLPKTLRTTRRKKIANYLASDEYAIFAVAKYIRDTANVGADLLKAGRLPETQKAYPSVTPAELRGNSWSQETIKLLASEYTSTPWNDKFHTGWGEYAIRTSKRIANIQSDLTNSSIQCQRINHNKDDLDNNLRPMVSQ